MRRMVVKSIVELLMVDFWVLVILDLDVWDLANCWHITCIKTISNIVHVEVCLEFKLEFKTFHDKDLLDVGGDTVVWNIICFDPQAIFSASARLNTILVFIIVDQDHGGRIWVQH